MALEDADGEPALRDRAGGREAGDARADDGDVDLFHGVQWIVVNYPITSVAITRGSRWRRNRGA